ncbi:MAG: phosphatidate cytidylyltransferase [Anaerolineales bacterium]|jgi:phosphatidate cytidylyltransferase
MLRERIATILILFPVLLWMIILGGWPFAVGMALILTQAVLEFGRMFRAAGYRPATPLMAAGVLTLAISRAAWGFNHTPVILSALLLAGMVWHTLDYERGAERSGTDFGITIAGVLYVGWMGSYLISLRMLPDGLWWLLLVLPTIWLADGMAYMIGKRWGRHKLARRVSPKKTWEGYLGGAVFGVLICSWLVTVWQHGAGPDSSLTLQLGAAVGVVVGFLAPIGDLGVSMIKRQTHLKDSGRLLPGHGGALDRMDSWLWAGAIGYTLLQFLIYGSL